MLNAMFVPAYPKPATLEELVEHILVARRITPLQREYLMNVFLKGTLNDSEIVLIDRILYGIRKGLLRVIVDDAERGKEEGFESF